MEFPQIKDYQFDTFLGEGATGQVFHAKDESGPFVVKILKRLSVNRKLVAYSLNRIQQAPQHPNIAVIKDFALEGRPLYVATKAYTHQDSAGAPHGYGLDSQAGNMEPELAWAIIRQIGEGLAHLHKHGVVHCSLNPRNIMVANPDTPEVRLTDFSQGWVTEITHIDFSESFLYAPPEQLRFPQEMFEGQAQRWDVYAFGATAFRLLYNQFPRAPHWIAQLRDGKVGFHPLALADVVAQQLEIHWPSTHGGFDEQRQRVLEKCLALDPADRYSDLRDVLDHFNRIDREERISIERRQAEERERVLSEKVGVSQKRMNIFRLAAMVLAGVSLFSIVLNVTSEARLAKSRQEIKDTKLAAGKAVKEARDAQDTASVEAQRLKSNLAYSQKTSDAFLEFLLKAKDPDSPEYQSIEGYLASAKQHYQRVMKATEGDGELLVEQMRARLGLAMIENQLGEPDAATAKVNSLVNDIRLLPEATRQSPDVQKVLAHALMDMGESKTRAGFRPGALQAMQESAKIYRTILREESKNFDLRRRFGKVLFRYGQLLAQTSDLARALQSQQNAMQILEELAQSADAREEDEYYLAQCQFEVGLIRFWENDGIAAFEAFQLASQGYSRLVSEKPQIPDYRFQLARCFYQLGILAFEEKGDLEESALARNTAHDLLTMLLQKYEGRREYQFLLALVFADIAEMERDAGQAEEAMANLSRSITILTELKKANATQIDYHYHLALMTALKGDFLIDADKQEEATKTMEQARLAFEALRTSESKPGIPQIVFEFQLASFYRNLGHAMESVNRKSEATKYFQEALVLLRELATKRPEDTRISDAIEALQSRVATPSKARDQVRPVAND